MTRASALAALFVLGVAAASPASAQTNLGTRVTIDVGGKTVNEALEAVVRQIDGEGVVMTQLGRGSWSQYRLVDKAREP